MDAKVAAALLKSLIGRTERDSQSGRFRLGSLSDLEVAALEFALTQVEPVTPGAAAPTPSALPPPADAATVEPARTPEVRRPPPPALHLSPHRARIADTSVTLCLDFGTARSKAFATRKRGDSYDLIELGMGEAAGEEHPYPLTSAVWVSESGRIYLGKEAMERSAEVQDRKRKRLDSLKQRLSQGGEHSLDTALAEGLENPTSTPLTYRDALTLYLAYLTDMAESELEKRGLPRAVRRRFALPAWDEQQLQVMVPKLREHLAAAQLVADTFRGQWKGGIPVEHVRVVMDELAAQRARWPMHLMAEHVLEPVAAGNSRLQTDDPARQLALVVDVGAGTTDFALFVVVEQPDNEVFRLSPVAGSMRAIRQAGDTVDEILRQHIVQHAGLDPKDPSFDLLNAQLQLSIRRYKEDLFTQGGVNYRLNDDRTGRIDLQTFLASSQVRAFHEKLEATCKELLEAAGRDKLIYYDAGLRVVLTGGGATLPMVAALAKGSSEHYGRSLRRAPTPPFPRRLVGSKLQGVYPQLAVAMGGAMPELPVVGRPVGVIKGAQAPTVVMPKGWT